MGFFCKSSIPYRTVLDLRKSCLFTWAIDKLVLSETPIQSGNIMETGGSRSNQKHVIRLQARYLNPGSMVSACQVYRYDGP